MSDPTEVRINLNARVTVRLTEAGRQMHVDYYRKLRLGDLCDSIPAAGEPYQTMLWDLMHVLGPGMRMGAHPMIEGMTFTAPVGKCVEVVRGEPAPDAPGLDLAPILARADAATEGPWRLQTAACDHPDADNHSAIKGGGALVVACAEDADATFIAHARTDIPALVAEVTRLRTALEHAIATGCAAVAEALREGEEARADLATARSRLTHIVAALRVAPSLDVPGDPTAARLCAHIEADRRDLARAGDEMLRLTRERDEARAERDRLRAVAPRWRDAGHGEYEMVVGTCTVGAILRVGDRIRPVAATEPLGFADSLPSAARAVCGRLGLPPVLDGLPEGGVKP